MARDDLELGHALADAADEVALRWFSESGLEAEVKDDGSPVTAADREVETTISARLAVERPSDGVLGEEVGPSGPTGRRWILDGIDGTHNFAAGRVGWSSHIALEEDGAVVLGIVTSPALQRRWWAMRGRGCWAAEVIDGRRSAATRLHVTDGPTLADASVTVIPIPDRLTGWKMRWVEALEIGGTGPTAFGLSAVAVASGETDLAVHAAGGPWDHAVGVALVEEAGGRFSDAWGGRRLDTGTALFSNGIVHEQALTTVSGYRPPPPP